MSSAEAILQPSGQIRLGDLLIANLRQRKWTHFRAAVAFAKQSGVGHIREALADFASRGQVKISIGVDQEVTTREGVQLLLTTLNGHGEVWVFHNRNSSTFHPKLYVFKNATEAIVAVGSGNLTEGGLFTNYEAGALLSLDLSIERDRNLLAAYEVELDRWSDPSDGLAKLVTTQELARLIEYGYLPSEAQAWQVAQARGLAIDGTPQERRAPLFASVPVPRAPVRARQPAVRRPVRTGSVAEPRVEIATGYSVFVMTLQRTDVGHGQTHPGKARRSPELFIPLAARDYAQDFWGWPAQFTADRANPGKMDRRGVRVRLAGQVAEVNMMTWPAKKDFRLRSELLRSAGNVGDILRLEKTEGRGGFEYYAEIIPSGTAQHDTYLQFCTEATRNSLKRWGYF